MDGGIRMVRTAWRPRRSKRGYSLVCLQAWIAVRLHDPDPYRALILLVAKSKPAQAPERAELNQLLRVKPGEPLQVLR